MLAQLLEEYPEDLRVVYRHFPLTSIHDKAALSAQAAEAAGLQGKFWEMHDLLFEKRDQWVEMEVADFEKWLGERAAELDLDGEKFAEDLKSQAIIDLVQSTWDHNSAIGMPGTPFLVINGQPYNGPVDKGNLNAIIRASQLESRQFSECPPMTIDPGKQ